MTIRRHALAALALLSLAGSACADDDRQDDADAAPGDDASAGADEPDGDDPGPTSTAVGKVDPSDRYRPVAATTWQWQLSGEIDTGYDVDLYDIDLFDSSADEIASLHADGRRVLCYFSAGTAEEWREDFGDFAPAVVGNPMEDWDGEFWLDVRAPSVLAVHEARLDLAVEKGCDGVEPDNVAGYDDDTGFETNRDDQIRFNRALADAAHARGFAVALKNSPDMVLDLVDWFDLAVTEECHEYDECDAYIPFVDQGKPVLNAEYADRWVSDESARTEMCAQAVGFGIQTLVLPLDLDDEFRFAC